MIKGFQVFIQTILLLSKVGISRKDEQSIAIFFQSPHIGGGRTFFYSLMDFMKKKNFKTTLFFAKDDFDEEIESFCRHEKIAYQIINYPLQLSYSGRTLSLDFLKYSYNYFRYFNSILRQVQVLRAQRIIVSSGWPFYLFFTLFLPGKKFIIQHVMPLHPLDKGNLFFLKLAKLFRQGTFISVSDFAQKNMRQYWLRSYPKVITIYNFFKKSHLYEKEESDTVRILCLARVEDGKNPFLWIDLAKELLKKHPNTELTWAGKGGLLEEARLRCSNHPSIRFIGFEKDVDSLYCNADIYFEPSKREAHGISAIGAMAWQLPVIATNNGGTVESVIDSETGFLVDVADFDQMLNRLESLLNNNKLRKDMGIKAKARYQHMFTKELWEEKMGKVLKC